jgi:o-succinylbenzoate synthase
MEPLDTPLEIAGCRLHEVAVPLVEPFRISGGTLATRTSLVVELTDRSGAVGYGESAPFEAPFYSGETVWSARGCIAQHLFPRLAGRTFGGLEAAIAALERGVRGNRMARAGVETALWDLVCAKAHVPLRRLIGAAMRRLGVPEASCVGRDYVESGAALGIPADERPATLAMQARAAVEQGYRRVKIKVMPGWDVEPVRAVREAIGAGDAARSRGAGMGGGIGIWADANGAYSREAHREALRALDREGLVMLEQPLEPDDVAGTIALAQELRTPVCLDESLTGEHAARLFLADDGPRIWNVKVQRVGGLMEAVRIYRLAVDSGVRLWAGSMPETGVGMHAVLSLASFAGFVLPSDAAPSARWYASGADLVEWTMDGEGKMGVSDAPGLASLGVGERLARLGTVVA